MVDQVLVNSYVSIERIDVPQLCNFVFVHLMYKESTYSDSASASPASSASSASAPEKRRSIDTVWHVIDVQIRRLILEPHHRVFASSGLETKQKHDGSQPISRAALHSETESGGTN